MAIDVGSSLDAVLFFGECLLWINLFCLWQLFVHLPLAFALESVLWFFKSVLTFLILPDLA